MVRQRRVAIGVGLGAVLVLGACATVDSKPDFERTISLVRESTGQDEVFSPEKPVLSGSEIDAALAGGLGLQEALRLALLNNRRLQAGFMRVGPRYHWASFCHCTHLRRQDRGPGCDQASYR